MDFSDPDDEPDDDDLPSTHHPTLHQHSTTFSPTAPLAATKPPAENTPTSSSTARRPARYRECLKNHAVAIGGHAVDGCGEFMPAGDDGSLDALKCAACGCHRNFHRRETDPPSSSACHVSPTYPPAHYSSYYRSPVPYLHPHHHRPHPPLALPSTSGGDDDELSDPLGAQIGVSGTVGSSGKKRFRTKFSQEQKERMLELAERLGWRIQKHDEGVVQQFCAEVGVKRHVFKVWMHNNKHTLGKKP